VPYCVGEEIQSATCFWADQNALCHKVSKERMMTTFLSGADVHHALCMAFLACEARKNREVGR